MKNRTALLVSVLLGVFAVFVVHLYVSQKQTDLEAGSAPQVVFVAADDIPENLRLEAAMVQRALPEELLPKPHVRSFRRYRTS